MAGTTHMSDQSDPIFRPWIFFRNAHLQTVLASSRIRAPGSSPMERAARNTILECRNGVRLLAEYSPVTRTPAKGLVILLHGWEGSSTSVYVRSTGRHLYDHGFDICRLNLRDHGNTHHLNPGLFFATLIEEVQDAVRQLAEQCRGGHAYLVGFSLGGNFALRVALGSGGPPVKNLEHTVCISPALDPSQATDRIDRQTFIRQYFLNKWRRSLRKKESLFPDRYRFSKVLTLRSIRAMTEYLIATHSPYTDAPDYFSRYTLTGDMLRDLRVPTTIFASEDDPIIPVEDFYELTLNHHTRLSVQRYGGHNGFVEGLSLGSWYDNVMVSLFTGRSDPFA